MTALFKSLFTKLLLVSTTIINKWWLKAGYGSLERDGLPKPRSH